MLSVCCAESLYTHLGGLNVRGYVREKARERKGSRYREEHCGMHVCMHVL